MLAVVLALIALLVVRMSLTQPLAKMARWTKAVRRGHAIDPPEMPDESLFGPIAREVTVLAKNLQRARAAAEEEAALRLIGQTLWTEERLKQFAKMRLGERPLVVVSNREPMSHVWKDGRIQVLTPGQRPGHRDGSGDARLRRRLGRPGERRRRPRDRGRAGPLCACPPTTRASRCKRVWLTPEEEAGYYYGFSNEGLWPLCHIVHTRPLFRPEDWAHYRAVNEKFAAAVLEEIAGTESPMVLIQDYHFALLPGLIKRERPDARTAIFWHIPWPNFEAFSHLPVAGRAPAGHAGRRPDRLPHPVLLQQLPRHGGARDRGPHRLGALLGHPRAARDARSSRSRSAWRPASWTTRPRLSRRRSCASLDTSAEFLGVGVERLDYTKGLPERFRALGRFFERFPEYRERLVFVQLAAPSRSTIPRYQALEAEVDAAVQEVNGRLPDQALEADPLPQAPPRAPRHLALLPPRRLLHGHVAARRHEPGRQGVHLGARRRGRRAHPEPVHRRLRRSCGTPSW